MKVLAWWQRVFEDSAGIPDEARIGAMLLIVAFVGNSVLTVLLNEGHVFNAQDFGIGAGALTAGVGAWLGLRKDN